MTKDRQICVARFSTDIAAEMARMRLEGNGIEAFISKDDCGGMEPHLQRNTGGVRLMVRKSDAEKASEILDEEK